MNTGFDILKTALPASIGIRSRLCHSRQCEPVIVMEITKQRNDHRIRGRRLQAKCDRGRPFLQFLCLGRLECRDGKRPAMAQASQAKSAVQ